MMNNTRKVLIDKLIHILYVISFYWLFLQSCDARKKNDIRLFIIGLIILIVGCSLSIVKKLSLNISKSRLKHFGLWGLVFISLIPGYMLNKLQLDTILRIIFIYVLYFILFSSGNITINDLAWGSVLSNIYVCYRCIFELGVTYSYYQGTTVNPNQFAMTLFGGILGALYLLFECKEKIMKIILIILELLFITFLAFSSSRTHMLALIISLIIFSVYYLHVCKNFYLLKNTKFKKSTVIGIGFFNIVMLFLIFYYRNNIITFFFNKWESNGDNLLSHREEIWSAIINGMSILYGSKIDLNTNGEFLNWINEYGFLSFICFFAFIIMSIKVAKKNYNLDSSLKNIFYIIVIFSYLFIAVFENIFTLFGKPINIMFLSTLGLIINELVENEKRLHYKRAD